MRPTRWSLNHGWESAGQAILDSGCTRTMHGLSCARRFEKELRERGLEFRSKSGKQSFKGVGGKIVCIRRWHRRRPRRALQLRGSWTASSPSVPALETQGTVIEVGKGVVSFETIGVKNLPLLKVSTKRFTPSSVAFSSAFFVFSLSWPMQRTAS